MKTKLVCGTTYHIEWSNGTSHEESCSECRAKLRWDAYH